MARWYPPEYDDDPEPWEESGEYYEDEDADEWTGYFLREQDERERFYDGQPTEFDDDELTSQ